MMIVCGKYVIVVCALSSFCLNASGSLIGTPPNDIEKENVDDDEVE